MWKRQRFGVDYEVVVGYEVDVDYAVDIVAAPVAMRCRGDLSIFSGGMEVMITMPMFMNRLDDS